MRIGYADPPYPGCAHMYKGHPDFAGEVDHYALVQRLNEVFDLATVASPPQDPPAPR